VLTGFGAYNYGRVDLDLKPGKRNSHLSLSDAKVSVSLICGGSPEDMDGGTSTLYLALRMVRSGASGTRNFCALLRNVKGRDDAACLQAVTRIVPKIYGGAQEKRSI